MLIRKIFRISQTTVIYRLKQQAIAFSIEGEGAKTHDIFFKCFAL